MNKKTLRLPGVFLCLFGFLAPVSGQVTLV